MIHANIDHHNHDWVGTDASPYEKKEYSLFVSAAGKTYEIQVDRKNSSEATVNFNFIYLFIYYFCFFLFSCNQSFFFLSM